MNQSIRLSVCALVTMAALACGEKQESSLASDTSLTRDLTIVENKAAPVTLADTAPSRTPAPTPPRQSAPPPRTTPRSDPSPPPLAQSTPSTAMPAPTPASATSGIIPVGSSTMASVGTAMCSNTAHPGDKFTGVLSQSLTGSNGVTIPAGSKAVMEVATVTPATESAEAMMTFRLLSFETNTGTSYMVAGDVVPAMPLEKTEIANPSDDKKKVIGGAVIGGILGQILGRDAKGTVIGAAAGAAAGTAAAKLSKDYASCLQTTNTVRIALVEGLTIPTR